MRSVRPGNLWNYSFIHQTQRSTKRSSSNLVFAIPETSRFRRWNGIAWEPWDGIINKMESKEMRSMHPSEGDTDSRISEAILFQKQGRIESGRTLAPLNHGSSFLVRDSSLSIPGGSTRCPTCPQVQKENPLPKGSPNALLLYARACVGIMSGRAFLPCLEFRVLGSPKKGGWRALGRLVWGWMNE